MRHDIAVIGGGVIGLCAAAALGQRGFKTLLVTKHPLQKHRQDDGRAFALSSSSCHFFEHLGLKDTLEPHCESMIDIIVSSGFRPSFHFTFSKDKELSGCKEAFFGRLVEAHELHNALVGIVEESPHVKVQVGSYEDTGEELAKLVVLAEGKNGALTQEKAGPFLKKDYKQLALVGTLLHDKPHNGLAYEYFLPTGPFALLPMTKNRTSFVWTEELDVGMALVKGERSFLQQQLKERVGDLLGSFTLFDNKVWHYPLHLSLATRLAGEGFCIVGDGAHVIHPLAGQGLNLGIRDVAALVDVLLEARHLGLSYASYSTLEAYERWRWADIASIALATHATNEVFSAHSLWLRPIQTLGVAAFEWMRPIKRWVTRLASGQMGDLPSMLKAP